LCLDDKHELDKKIEEDEGEEEEDHESEEDTTESEEDEKARSTEKRKRVAKRPLTTESSAAATRKVARVEAREKKLATIATVNQQAAVIFKLQEQKNSW